jgi:methyl-accepting chemotaxis protein
MSLLENNPEKKKELEKKILTNEQDIQALVSDFHSLALEKGKEIAKNYQAAADKWFPSVLEISRLSLENKIDEAVIYIAKVENPLRVEALKYNSEMSELTRSRLAEAIQEAKGIFQMTRVVSTVIAILGILLSSVLAFFMIRSVTGAIKRVISTLTDNATQVTAAATQIASSSEELSQATTEQAASLEQTAASVEELNSMIAKNTENAKSAENFSGDSQKKASEGKAIVEKMTQSMEAINQSNAAIMNQVNQSNESMTGIVKVIEQIDKKTKVINEIVNKTELLSFNASVEAARAGEHGKGFAVVAEEVGNLARMSGVAAEEIATLLEESISKVNQIVHDTKTSVEKLISEGQETIENGARVARECGEVFEEVVQNVTSVSGMATEISSASQEQARGCEEITKAMSQLDHVTQQNAATSEEAASAAEELSAQAESLKGTVAQLVLVVNGGGTAQVPESQLTDPRAISPSARPMVSPPPSTATTNVVRLRSSKSKSNGHNGRHHTEGLKKSIGEAPYYESAGFEDV